MSEDALQRGLAHLQAAEFLYETRLFPERDYTFKHALTHEVAYGSLLQERRRGLHARIVESPRSARWRPSAEQVERLAHHALRGEVWDKALAYCRQAGEKAMARSAHREAVGYFEQALVPWRICRSSVTRASRPSTSGLPCAGTPASGDFGRILACLREAEALAEAPRRPAAAGTGLRPVCQTISAVMGAYDQAIAAAPARPGARHRQRGCRPAGPGALRLGQAYQTQGDYRRAIDCLGQTVASLDGARRRERFSQASLPAVP